MRKRVPGSIFNFLQVPARNPKPREIGMTLLLDRCLPTPILEEFLRINSEIVDCIKIVDHCGMLTRYSPVWLKERLKICSRYGIESLPSGLSFEVAYTQGKAYAFFDTAKELGFSAIEISDDVIPEIPAAERDKLILYAQKIGLIPFTEIGRKFPDEPIDLQKSVETIRRDLSLGVKKVTIERGELVTCKNTGSRLVHQIVEEVGMGNVFLEPGPGDWPDLPKWTIENFGPDVNLENIEIEEIQRVEAMRHGLDRLVQFSFFKE